MPYIWGIQITNKIYINMKFYLLQNGNTIKIENEYCWSDIDSTKVTFDLVHVQKNGYWKHRET